VKLVGTAAFSKVVVVKDGKESYTVSPNTKEVSFVWTDAESAPGSAVSYYYVRGEQSDGQVVWASPMWIARK
jgi:hypothetical protein